ncbi:hypothetical protein K2173_006425 [Erythroxylum novogranatense]|uniref:EF-hand domain-containing protein n=1 Tax=Erythroxylum novogranatense TaxID=1862640 RepID=A0AAV8U756_9ROSI|nr:hypothetical protein K2173_006425 [Erythroxylum novogranatense]
MHTFHSYMSLFGIVSTFLNLFSHFLRSLHVLIRSPSTQKPNPSHKREEKEVSVGEITMVLDRLQLFYDVEGDKLQERYNASEVSRLFELEEPTLEELKGAFDIFDENKDGLIDAMDLRRVLCSLGLKKAGSQEVMNCERKIRAINKDGNGNIDFDDFVRFMEKCF